MRIQRCRGCGRHAFPPRRWCPDCGGDSWEDVHAGEGVVESATVLRDGTRVGTVRLDAGPAAVVLIRDAVVEGDRLSLQTAASASSRRS